MCDVNRMSREQILFHPPILFPTLVSFQSTRREPQVQRMQAPPFLEGAVSTEALAARTATLWKTNPFNRAQLPEAFKNADASGDGRIDRKEFRELLGVNASQAELDKLFAQVDKDGDGELDLDEVRKVSGSPSLFALNELPTYPGT